ARADERHRVSEVQRELRGWIRRLRLLLGGARPGVKLGAPGGSAHDVQRLTDEPMGEPVAAHAHRLSLYEPRGRRIVQCLQNMRGGFARRASEQLDVEVAPDDRCELQDVVDAIRQPVEATHDHVAYAFRQVEGADVDPAYAIGFNPRQ